MFSFYRLIEELNQLDEFKLSLKDAAKVKEFKGKMSPSKVKQIAIQLRRSREKATHTEAMDQLDEYRWEKDLPLTTKLKPSVFFPLRRAKKETKRSWEDRARLKDPGRIKELFKKHATPPAGKQASAFLAGAYKASRTAAQKEKESAYKAAHTEGVEKDKMWVSYIHSKEAKKEG